jgi:hypothetical protein
MKESPKEPPPDSDRRRLVDGRYFTEGSCNFSMT